MTKRLSLMQYVRSLHPSALIFDLDGTLVESENLHFESLSYALSRQGLDVSHSWYACRTGLSLDQLLEELADHAPVKFDVKRAASDQLAYFSLHLGRLRACEDCLALLRQFEHSVPLALATNNLTCLTHRILTQFALREKFQAIACSDTPGLRPKPSPDTYRHCVEELGVPSKTCVVIEDSTEGLDAARRAGCFAIDVRRFRQATDRAYCRE